MPLTPRQRRRLLLGMFVPWRRVFAKRAVHRHVQGVGLVMPWAHALPAMARVHPTYGQNLVALAEQLHDRNPETPLTVLDIGANIGDTALQIASAVDARVLCVEGDPYWADYLHRNVDSRDEITVVEALLAPDAQSWADSTPVRQAGTTRFVQDADRQGALPLLPAADLRAQHPAFDALRLLKSDTDGFDPVLVVAVATAWKDRAPVLFFEFDPTLARKTGDDQPNLVWERLAELGYSRVAIWDNAGDPLGQLDIGNVAAATTILEPRPVHLGYDFWDVAVCHADDVAARAAFDALVPEAYGAPGTS